MFYAVGLGYEQHLAAVTVGGDFALSADVSRRPDAFGSEGVVGRSGLPADIHELRVQSHQIITVRTDV